MTPPNRPRPPAGAPRPSARAGIGASRVHAAQARRLHFLLRDGTAVEGVVQVGEGQSLVSFLNSRSGWMSITKAAIAKSDEPPGHLIVNTDHIIMAGSPDGAVQVSQTPASGSGDRLVELVLLGGRIVRGYLPTAPGQRLSDCVASSGKFVAIALARLFPEGTDVGDVALQTAALQIVRDMRRPGMETQL